MIIVTRKRTGTCLGCAGCVVKVLDISVERGPNGAGATKLSLCTECVRRMAAMADRLKASDGDYGEWP